MEPNRSGMAAVLKLNGQINSPVYDARQDFMATNKALRTDFSQPSVALQSLFHALTNTASVTIVVIGCGRPFGKPLRSL